MAKAEELKGGETKEDAAKIFDNVLDNTATEAQKNVVIANAAYAIQVVDEGNKSIEECVSIARESIESGRAKAAFKKYVELSD